MFVVDDVTCDVVIFVAVDGINRTLSPMQFLQSDVSSGVAVAEVLGTQLLLGEGKAWLRAHQCPGLCV